MFIVLMKNCIMPESLISRVEMATRVGKWGRDSFVMYLAIRDDALVHRFNPQ